MGRKFDNVTTRDQLGRPEDRGFFNKRFSDRVEILESPIKVVEDTIGHSWIVGSSTNGIVGTNTNTADGEQQVVGSAGRVQTIKSVDNHNNTVYEKFSTTLFIDSASDALYGSGSAVFSSGSALVSERVYLGSTSISRATILTEQTGTPLTLYMSNTGTASMESVTDNTEHSFSTSGTALWWKAEASGGTATLTKVTIIYE